MEVYTIGFTKKSAAEFFGALKRAGIRRLIDVRLRNSAQLAGFSKKEDLAYFLKEICGAEYVHEPLLAPTDEMLDAYKDKKLKWPEYEKQFLDLMAQRHIEDRIEKRLFDAPAVLLCSEPTAEKCHRRLVADYLRTKWGNLNTKNL